MASGAKKLAASVDPFDVAILGPREKLIFKVYTESEGPQRQSCSAVLLTQQGYRRTEEVGKDTPMLGV